MEDLEILAVLGKTVIDLGRKDPHEQDARGWNRFHDTAMKQWAERLQHGEDQDETCI